MLNRMSTGTRRIALGGTAAVLVLGLAATASNAAVPTANAMPPVTTTATTAVSAQVAAAEAQALAEQAAAAAAAEAQRQARRDSVVSLAKAQRGDAYVYGASGPNTFDCSGFTMWTYQQAAGVSLPHNTHAQWNAVDSWYAGEREPQPGDLVFFFNGADHVGMYIGDGMMVHAANPRTGVTVDSVTSGYWAGRLTGYGRVLS